MYHANIVRSPFAELEYGAGAGALSGPAARRADGLSMYGSRTPAWHGNVGDRHSPLPFNESSENRRRVRPRHGSLRGFGLGRPHFAASPVNSNPQTQVRSVHHPYTRLISSYLTWRESQLTDRLSQQSQQYQHPWLGRPNPGHSHNRQHGLPSPANAAPRAPFEANGASYQFQPQTGAPSEPYLNPLNISGSGSSEEYAALLPQMRSAHMGALSPTYPGPEVYMSNADDPSYGGPVSRQQL